MGVELSIYSWEVRSSGRELDVSVVIQPLETLQRFTWMTLSQVDGKRKVTRVGWFITRSGFTCHVNPAGQELLCSLVQEHEALRYIVPGLGISLDKVKDGKEKKKR